MICEGEMSVKKNDAVAGEMYLPGATIKLSKTPARSGEASTPDKTPTGVGPPARLRSPDL